MAVLAVLVALAASAWLALRLARLPAAARAYIKTRRLELALPGPPSLPLLGNALDIVGVRPDDLVQRILRLWGGRFGPSRLSLLGELTVLLSDAEDAERLLRGKDTQDKSTFFYKFLAYFAPYNLFSINGPTWRRHKRAIGPAFHRDVLERYVSVFADEAAGLARRVADSAGTAVDVCEDALGAVGSAWFRTALVSGHFGEEEQRAFAAFAAYRAAVLPAVNRRAFTPWLWPDAVYRLTPTARAVRRMAAPVDAYILKTMRSRSEQRAAGGAGPDFIAERRTFLDALLDAMMADGEAALSEAEVLDEMKTSMSAATEVTVAGLSFALKALSVRPDMQERARREVRAVLGPAGSPASARDLERLEYTECVINEAFRLMPPAPFLARVSGEDEHFGEAALPALPAGTTLVLNVWALHRNPRHWPEPERFDPERFAAGAERGQGRHPFAHVPFSAGPRKCPGAGYGMMIVKTLLAALLQRYRIEPGPDGLTEPADFPIMFSVSSRLVAGANKVVFTPLAEGDGDGASTALRSRHAQRQPASA